MVDQGADALTKELLGIKLVTKRHLLGARDLKHANMKSDYVEYVILYGKI